MGDVTKHSILLVTPERSLSDSISEALSSNCCIEVEASAEAAARRLAQKPPTVVLCSAELLEAICAQLGEDADRALAQSRWGIITAGRIEEYFDLAFARGIFNIFPENFFRDKDKGTGFLENLVYPERAFGLRRYLRTPHMLFGEAIRTKTDKREVIEKAINYFATCGHDIHELYDVRLVLEEMVNNSLFHAFVNEGGEERYHVSQFEHLAASEHIQIEFGNDAESIGFSVTDNGGRLKPARIVEKLARHYNRQGIYDESGRGLYLMRMFSSLLIINIEKNKRTQMIAIFGEKSEDVPKPLCTNYFE